MEDKEIKCCPNPDCGSYSVSIWVGGTLDYTDYCAECDVCDMRGPSHGTPDDAWRSWNRLPRRNEAEEVKDPPGGYLHHLGSVKLGGTVQLEVEEAPQSYLNWEHLTTVEAFKDAFDNVGNIRMRGNECIWPGEIRVNKVLFDKLLSGTTKIWRWCKDGISYSKFLKDCVPIVAMHQYWPYCDCDDDCDKSCSDCKSVDREKFPLDCICGGHCYISPMPGFSECTKCDDPKEKAK